MGYEPIKEETKEQYLKIWINYSVGHFNQQQLAQLFACSEDTISNAIKWAAENRTQFNTSILAEAAKETLEARLRELKNDCVRIKEANPTNWNAYAGIIKLIQADEQLLWQLQTIIQNRSIITINATQVNQLLKARDEIVEGMSDGERQQVISRIREIVNKQGDN